LRRESWKWIAWSVVYAKLRLVRRVVNMVDRGEMRAFDHWLEV
jgi:hypothetical protein